MEPTTNSRSDTGAPPPLRIAMLLYPGMTLLDLAGPQSALGMHGETYLVWKDNKPVWSDSGVAVLPTHTFDDCPSDIDVLFVPGGFGTADWMEDEHVLAFLAREGAKARYITSVCSGALILASAGLLDGYKAATHWRAHDALSALGIAAVRERVVVDRNRMTGGGVTAGIDFGLTLLAKLRGKMTAEITQLAMEYDPAPPYDSGSPEKASPEIVAAFNAMTSEMDTKTRATVARIQDRKRK